MSRHPWCLPDDAWTRQDFIAALRELAERIDDVEDDTDDLDRHLKPFGDGYTDRRPRFTRSRRRRR